MAPVYILEVRGPETRHEYRLDGSPVSLGRADDNVVVLEHASVSRYHARIEWVEGQPQVTDLESANGTRVNETAIAPDVTQPLAPGDRIQIVGLELTLREPAAGEAERRDVSGQPLPDDKPALLTHAEPASVSLFVNTQHRAKRYPIEEESLTIGRDPANDICIDELVVSWHHARLERMANGYRIVDLGSSNGLTCQEVEVAQMLLADGDELWIASDVCLTYRITPVAPEALITETPVREEAPPPAEMPVPEEEASPAPETPVFEKVAPPSPPPETPTPEPVATAMAREAIPEEAAPLYATMTGTETPSDGLQKIDMRQRKELTIGRSPENDLQLSYRTISRHHARIRRVGDTEEYVIEDLDSSNGTVVNDELIAPGELHPLHPGSTLRIGPIKLIFAPETVQLVDESRDLRLDALHLNQFVGKGTNLLQDISLAVLPREFVALVGVSGAGKSTLMNALAGFWPASDGVVLVNGTDLYQRFDVFRTDLGYVPQDDIIHKELTAEKALDYAARLRLPPDMTAAERKEAVTAELEILGLTERKDVRVGSLSGGQRKRVSIGVERLTRPGLFFLDEATSGLDPGTENRLMRLLRQLADEGQTIVLITHATKNVMLCDQVIFLAAGGRLAYFGPPGEALAHFGVAAFDEIYEQLEEERSPEAWAELYRQSPQYRGYVVKRLRDKYGERLEARPEPQTRLAAGAKVKRPSALRQFGVLAARYLDIIRTDRINLLLMLLIAPVLGAMDLIAWPRETYDPVEGDAARAMVMLFLAVIIPFLIGALGSVREVVKERAIYRRERTVNLRIVPYLLSKVAVGFLFALYTAAALLILKLISVDFSHLGMGDLALVYLILLLAVASGVMWGLLISAVAPREEQAMLLLIVIVVVQMVFSGGILPLDQLGTAGEVIGGITSSKWTFEAMVDVTQVQRGDCAGPSLEDCELAGVQAYETDAERQVVITHLEDRYGQVLEGDVTTSIAALLGILIGLFVLLAVIQKRKDVI
jgi:ABC-type multidrug transport system ATPase subunit/pSer/pThr/pTyr-binding forkhead associated (FHA) protein